MYSLVYLVTLGSTNEDLDELIPQLFIYTSDVSETVNEEVERE